MTSRTFSKLVFNKTVFLQLTQIRDHAVQTILTFYVVRYRDVLGCTHFLELRNHGNAPRHLLQTVVGRSNVQGVWDQRIVKRFEMSVPEPNRCNSHDVDVLVWTHVSAILEIERQVRG